MCGSVYESKGGRKTLIKLIKFSKLLLSFVAISLIISGCDKNQSTNDIVKLTSDEHSLIKEYSSFNKDNSMNEGLINLKAGNLQQAIEILEKVVTYYPNNAMAHFYLGKAYYENNEPDKFIIHTKQSFLTDKSFENELSAPVVGKDIIGRVFVTNEADKEKNLASKPMVWFDKNIPFIYTSLEIINAPINTEIEAELVYELSKNEVIDVNSVSFKIEGSKNTTKNTIISIKKPTSEWPEGKYKLNIYVNGQKNTHLNFYIF